MKKLLLALILLPFISKAQIDSAKLEWSDITEIKGSKNELFQKYKAWLYSFFRKPGDYIQEMDSVSGAIIVGHLKFNATFQKYPVSCMIGIDVKDNKVRFRVYDYTRIITNYTSYEEGYRS